jgi:uncharacterized protein
MKRLAGMIVLAACLALPARAQDAGSPEALAAARELAAIVTGDSMGQLTGAMTAQIWPTIERQVGSKVDAATLAEMRGEFERTVTAFTGEVMKDAPAVYARHFSAKELREMVAFYKSPTGTKALHEMPKVIADVGAEMAPRMQAFQSELNDKMRAILQKHGYKD